MKSTANTQGQRPMLLLVAVYAAKLLLLALFSSGYKDQLFYPFVEYFTTHWANPWQHFHARQPDMFPYPPLMLVLLAPFQVLAALAGPGTVAANLVFKLPLLLADFAIYKLLVDQPARRNRIYFWLWHGSIIVLFSTFVHSQLDIIPVALLTGALYLLKKEKYWASALLLGAAIATKSTALAALPLLFLFVWRNAGWRQSLGYAVLSAGVYAAVSLPVLFTRGYRVMVLENPKLMTIYDAVFHIGTLEVYLLMLSALVIFARFGSYAKVNLDLLYSFSGMLFAVFVGLIIPAPGWYVWLMPFLLLFVMRHGEKDRKLLPAYVGLNLFYFFYFVFFHIPEYIDIKWLGEPVWWKVGSRRGANFAFTLLEFGLAANVYLLYKTGVRSNSVYRHQHGLLLGIGGDSGAGKSTLLGDLRSLFNDRLLELEGDADHRWERGSEQWKQYTHLDPRANLLHQQADQLMQLKSGKRIFRRDYDHNTGKFTISKAIEPHDLVVLSGLHPFYLPKMRKLLDLKVYLDTDEKLRLYWKIARDTAKRGHSKEKIIEQIKQREADSARYIHPQKQFADVVVRHYTPDDALAQGYAGPPPVFLMVTIDASIQLEPLVEAFGKLDIPYMWDYQDDLKSQYIDLQGELPDGFAAQLAYRLVPNLDELLPEGCQWQNGNRGLLQLIMLMAISQKMTEPETSENEWQ